MANAGWTAVKNRHGEQPGTLQQTEALLEAKKLLSVLVVNIKLEKIVRQLLVMDRVFGVKPFPVEDKTISQERFKDGALHCGPLFEKVVLRMHALSDFVATTLEHHSARPGEVHAYIGTVELFLNDQRGICDESLGFLQTKVLVIVGPLGAKKVRRPVAGDN